MNRLFLIFKKMSFCKTYAILYNVSEMWWSFTRGSCCFTLCRWRAIVKNVPLINIVFVPDPLFHWTILRLLEKDIAVHASTEPDTEVSLPGSNCPQHIWNSSISERKAVHGSPFRIRKWRSSKTSSWRTSVLHLGCNRFQARHQGIRCKTLFQL